MSSLSAIMGNRGQVNYAAAKAGLIGAVRALSLECASRGITVNGVAPGIIASPAVDAVLGQEQDRGARADEAGRPARGGRRPRGLPGLRPRRLHLRPGDLDQWRARLTLRPAIWAMIASRRSATATLLFDIDACRARGCPRS